MVRESKSFLFWFVVKTSVLLTIEYISIHFINRKKSLFTIVKSVTFTIVKNLGNSRRISDSF